MALAIPAAVALFSVLQEALKANAGHRVRLTHHTHNFMQDFHWLVDDVGARPTSMDELVPDHTPSTHGACDASKKGLGGVQFVPLLGGQVPPSCGAKSGPPPSSLSLSQLPIRPAPSPIATSK
jgi:hypothetical protein